MLMDLQVERLSKDLCREEKQNKKMRPFLLLLLSHDNQEIKLEHKGLTHLIFVS